MHGAHSSAFRGETLLGVSSSPPSRPPSCSASALNDANRCMTDAHKLDASLL